MVLEESQLRAHVKVELLLSIFIIIACVSIAYLLICIDLIVNQVLYQFGLHFSYDWANLYWTVFRMSLSLLNLVAVGASFNIVYLIYNFRWKRKKKT